MHRFYIPSLKIQGKLLTIDDRRIIHQVGRVLRMRPGNRFNIFNEKEWMVEILEIKRQEILVNVIESVKNIAEPSIAISLYQAIPKKTALFELIIQKATEIGVSHIYPLITERTEKRRLTKFEQLFAIAMEATEQCGRIKIPMIHHPVSFEDILPQLSNAYVAYEYETKKYLSDYKNLIKNNEAQIIIGPEGGFSQKEIELAKQAKLQPFSLGPRILRIETAAIAALSLFLLGKEL